MIPNMFINLEMIGLHRFPLSFNGLDLDNSLRRLGSKDKDIRYIHQKDNKHELNSAMSLKCKSRGKIVDLA